MSDPDDLLETVAFRDDRLLHLEHHQARLDLSMMQVQGRPAPRLASLLCRPRVVLPAGSGLVRLCFEARRRADEPGIAIRRFSSLPVRIHVALAAAPRRDPPAVRGHKRADRSWLPVLPARAFEVLVWTAGEGILEGTRTNVVLLRHGRCATPPAEGGLVSGVVRARLMARGLLVERRLDRGDLDEADALYLTGAGVGVLAVDQFGRRRFDWRRYRTVLEELRSCLDSAPWPEQTLDGR